MSSSRRRGVAFLVVALAIVGAGYASRVAWLSLGATDSTVLAEEKECASGGCWMTFDIRPPEGQPAAALAADLEATPHASIPGDFMDPRTISLFAEPQGNVLMLRADYWSTESAR
jgi:hypothetical protein